MQKTPASSPDRKVGTAMKIWIDNSGLHSAAQCLDGRASLSHDYHLRGLLQFATLIIFSDSLSLNGFEDSGIAARSAERR